MGRKFPNKLVEWAVVGKVFAASAGLAALFVAIVGEVAALFPKNGAVVVAAGAGLGLVTGLVAAVVAPPNRDVVPVGLFEVFPKRLVGLLVFVASFGLFPKLFDAKPPNELAPVAGGFPKRLVVLAVFNGFAAFVVVVGFNGFTVAPVFNGFVLVFIELAVAAPSVPAGLVLPATLLLFVLLKPPKSEGLLLVEAPIKFIPVLAVYLFVFAAPTPPNRLPEVLDGWDEVAVLLPPNIEVGFGEVEAVGRGFPKLVAPPPNKPAGELLFAAGGFVLLFWPKRPAPVEFAALPKRLVPGTELLFIICLYENYKIQTQHIQVPLQIIKIINISLFL